MSDRENLEMRRGKLLEEISRFKGELAGLLQASKNSSRPEIFSDDILRKQQQLDRRNRQLLRIDKYLGNLSTLAARGEKSAGLFTRTKEPSVSVASEQKYAKQPPQKSDKGAKSAEPFSRRAQEKKHERRDRLVTEGEKTLNAGKKFVAAVAPKVDEQYEKAKKDFTTAKKNFKNPKQGSTQGADLEKDAEKLLKKTQEMQVESQIAGHEEALSSFEKTFSGVDTAIEAFAPPAKFDPEVERLLTNVNEQVNLEREEERVVSVEPSLTTVDKSNRDGGNTSVDQIVNSALNEAKLEKEHAAMERSDAVALEAKHAALIREHKEIDSTVQTSKEPEPAISPAPSEKNETASASTKEFSAATSSVGFDVPTPSAVASEAPLYPNLSELPPTKAFSAAASSVRIDAPVPSTVAEAPLYPSLKELPPAPQSKPTETKKANAHSMPSWSTASATAGIMQALASKDITSGVRQNLADFSKTFSTVDKDGREVLKDEKTILKEHVKEHKEERYQERGDYETALSLQMEALHVYKERDDQERKDHAFALTLENKQEAKSGAYNPPTFVLGSHQQKEDKQSGDSQKLDGDNLETKNNGP